MTRIVTELRALLGLAAWCVVGWLPFAGAAAWATGRPWVASACWGVVAGLTGWSGMLTRRARSPEDAARIVREAIRRAAQHQPGGHSA